MDVFIRWDEQKKIINSKIYSFIFHLISFPYPFSLFYWINMKEKYKFIYLRDLEK